MKRFGLPLLLILASCATETFSLPYFDSQAVSDRYPAVSKLIVLAQDYRPPKVDPASGKESWRVDDQHVLRAGMKIKVDVIGSPELGNVYIIPEHGAIELPHVRKVQVAGNTAGAVKGEIEQKLKNFINNPQVIVSVGVLEVQEDRTGSVAVAGMVQEPGEVTLLMRGDKPGQPLAPPSLFLAIAQARRFRHGAAISQIFVLRHDKTRSRVENIIVTDWTAYEMTHNTVYNVRIQPGDIVIVPKIYPEDQTVAREFESINEYVLGRIDRGTLLSRLR